MTKQGHLALARHQVFLTMIHRRLRGVGADRPAAVRTVCRGRHLDKPVVLGRRGAEPAAMTHRSAALPRVGRRSVSRWLRLRGRVGLPLPIRGEFGLPLQLEFKLQPLDLLLERLVLGHQLRDGFPSGIQLTIQPVEAVIALVGRLNQTSQRRAPQMRAMADLRASVLMLGIKAERHEHSSLNAPNPTAFHETRPAESCRARC